LSTFSKRRSAFALLVTVVSVLSLGLAGCSDSDSGGTSSTTVADTISVSDVWARSSAMEAGNGAVFFTVANNGSAADALVSASVSTQIALEAQLHEVVMMSNPGAMAGDSSQMMKMQQVVSVAIPAGGTVGFKPGSFHVMLMDLTDPLVVGSTFPLTLNFAEAGAVQVMVEVRAS
jgi:copper(I)-binding protein